MGQAATPRGGRDQEEEEKEEEEEEEEEEEDEGRRVEDSHFSVQGRNPGMPSSCFFAPQSNWIAPRFSTDQASCCAILSSSIARRMA